jgi:cytochrome d ubiquinol oxidase subunit II
LLWVALGVALVSLATPIHSETVRERWFDFPRTLAVMLLPLATIGAGFWLWRTTERLRRGEAGGEARPYAAAAAIFVLAFAGLAYSLYPYIVIDRITIWEAAAHPSGLKALLVGAAVVLPFIFGYTILSYRIFRGKAKAGLYD